MFEFNQDISVVSLISVLGYKPKPLLKDGVSVHSYLIMFSQAALSVPSAAHSPGVVLFSHLFLITSSDHTDDVCLAKVTINAFGSFVVFT